MRRLPLVVERGLASTRLAKTQLSHALQVRVGHENITCRQGCNHCCHYPLTISLWEGLGLYQGLRREGLWRPSLKASLERHAALTFETAPEVWLMATIPCPLLDEGRCAAYQDRPFACRATLSTRDPDLCRGVYFGPGTFEDVSRERAAFEALEHQASRAARDQVRGLDQHVPISVAVLIGYQVMEDVIPLEDVPAALLRLARRSS